MAGELVGWVDLELDEDNVLQGSVSYARIAAGGALYSRQIDKDKGRVLYSDDNIKGFESTVELEFFSLKGADYQSSPGKSPGIWGANFRPRDGKFGSSLSTRPEKGRGKWVVGEDYILPTIREQLAKHVHESIYPNVYYDLAYMAEEENVLADPSMSDRTHREKQFAEVYHRGLKKIRDLDRDMVRNLTAFTELKPAEIPEAFATSRREVGKTELTLLKTIGESTLQGWTLRVGYRPSGRTWPYMDPEAKDEQAAFGRELSELKERNVTPASHELKREIEELEGRLNRAGYLVARLGVLASKEATKVT
jgi:hypothetical protein